MNVNGVLIKYKKQKKALEYAKLKLTKLEDENIDLKLKMQNLNRNNANLSRKLLKIGGKPDTELDKSLEQPVIENSDEDMKILVEENEALRKGLHEVLEGLQKKIGTPFFPSCWLHL